MWKDEETMEGLDMPSVMRLIALLKCVSEALKIGGHA